MGFKQKMSFIERAYFAYPENSKVCYINVVIESKNKNEMDIDKLKTAIETLSNINPNMRLIAKGYLNFTYFVDSGVPPPLRVIEKSTWDGTSSDTIDFLNTKINDKELPLAEIIYIKGSTTRIVFRIHHVLTDGRGALLWIEDLFRILRNEKPVSFFSKLNPHCLMVKNKVAYRKPFERNCIAPTGKTVGGFPTKSKIFWGKNGRTSFKTRWIRKTIRLNSKISHFIGHIAVLLASEARKYTEGNFCVAIPIDLRYRENYIKTTRNFTGLIYVDIRKEDSPADITAKIDQQLKNAEDLMFERIDVLSRFIPLCLIRHTLMKRLLKSYYKNLYGSSAMISNIGFIDAQKFSTNNFITDSVFVFFEQIHYPAGFCITYCNNNLEIVLTVPDVLRTNDRDEKLLDKIANDIKSINST